ncbi:MAG: glycoside hydrolase family 92 protein, partial [Bacteroidaceae bacterium]|nr:glycoside hydrolase family 92 protein [Bacteroidaceae bacterium]
LFDCTVLHLPNGKSLTIKANDLSRENIFVKAVRLNGETLTTTFITHAQILQGGTLEFDMTDEQ